MGISCTKLRFFGKKRVFLVHCDVCCSLCNVVDIVKKKQDLFQHITVAPSADLSRMEYIKLFTCTGR